MDIEKIFFQFGFLTILIRPIKTYLYFCNMLKKKTIIFLLICGCISSSYAQKLRDYTQYSFRSPLNIPLVLAGNFGELRSNHFHTGIDIKTNGRTGYNIYAVEDGYVSRIKIRPWGYGHALYITHPNGITSVYGHLKKFAEKIHIIARTQQRKKKHFSIDYYPAKGALTVKKGEIIAKSGNTGSSAGPHLHFELRDTKTEHPLNPLLFHCDIKDTRPPLITRLKVYALTKEGYMVPNKNKYYRVYERNGSYSILNNTVTIPAAYTSEEGGIGFAFDTFDKLNEANNPCGVDQLFLIIDGDTIYSQDKSYLDFRTNRYVNSHTDYKEFQAHRYYYEKTFKTKNDPLPIYRNLKKNGIFKAQPGANYLVQFISKDVYGNTSTLNFKLIVEKGEKIQQQSLYSGKKLLYPDSAFLSYDSTHYIFFPPGSIYEPTPLILKTAFNSIQFGNPDIPLQSSFKIMLPLPNLGYDKKYYIQRKNERNQSYSEGGVVKKGWITTRVKEFGLFSVQIDTISPTIHNRNFRNKEIVNNHTLSWSINEKESGLKNYALFIDNKWFLLQYAPKRRRYYFSLPKAIKGKKTVVIHATDNCGNTAIESYQLTF